MSQGKLGLLLGALLGMLGGYACNGHGECRFDPDCGGGIGGFCDHNRDCVDGHCCRSDNCGGGMCTFECDRDADCPDDMACEHDKCFFRCSSDRDCARGQECTHNNTVCEWD